MRRAWPQFAGLLQAQGEAAFVEAARFRAAPGGSIVNPTSAFVIEPFKTRFSPWHGEAWLSSHEAPEVGPVM